MFDGTWCTVCQCDLPRNRCGHVTRKTKRVHRYGAKHVANANKQANALLDQIEAERISAVAVFQKQKQERLCMLALAVASHRIAKEYGSVGEARETALVIAESVVIEDQLRPTSASLGKLIAAKIVLNAANGAYDVVSLVAQWM